MEQRSRTVPKERLRIVQNVFRVWNNDHETVPKGRLRIAQDVFRVWNNDMNSPEGTAENTQDVSPGYGTTIMDQSRRDG
jgi:hypothetical protein